MMMTQIKQCLCCGNAFRPQYSDSELMTLFYSEEEIETHEILKKQYGHYYSRSMEFPKQHLCEKCATDPRLRMRNMFSIFGDDDKPRGLFYLEDDKHKDK